MPKIRGSMVIIGAGSALFFTAIIHHLREITRIFQITGPVAALALDAGLAVGLIYAGGWLRQTELSSAEEWSVAIWTLLGGTVGAVLIGLTHVVQLIEQRPITEPVFQLLVAIGGGALVLFVAGYYANKAHAASRQYQSVFNNTFQFTGLLEPDGTVVAVNQAALSFGGFELEEVVGRQFDTISWWTHSEAVQQRLQNALKTAANGDSVRYQTQVRGGDGLKTIEFSTRPIVTDDENVTKIVVEGRDITTEEQQREHLQVIQRVLRHNMRNDLQKLCGWVGLLADTTDPEARERRAERINCVLDGWKKMTSDLEPIHKAITSDEKVQQTVPLHRTITAAVDTNQQANPQAAIEMSGPDTPNCTVRPVVEEAFDELLCNAVNAAPDENIRVSVEVSHAADGWIEVVINDNGPGLPDAEAVVLETGQETALEHGDALGVWKVRTIIKQIGGNITVDRSVGGASICVRIPQDTTDHTGARRGTLAPA